MKTLLESLQGYKTYVTGVVVFVLLFGVWQHWWIIPTEVYAGLAALMMMFIRNGVKNDVGSSLAANAPSGAGNGAPRTEGPGAAGRAIVGMAFVVAGVMALVLMLAIVACTRTTTVTQTVGPGGAITLQTNTVSTLDTNAVIAGINAVVPSAVRFACQRDGNAGPYFEQAALVMRVASDNGQYDPAAIRDSLSRISIRELRTQNAITAEEAGLAIYGAFFGQVVGQQLDKEVWLRPVLRALGDAIQSGLAGGTGGA